MKPDNELARSFEPDIDEGISWQSLLIFTGCAVGTLVVVGLVVGAIIWIV